MFFHFRFESFLIHCDTALASDLARHFERKPVGGEKCICILRGYTTGENDLFQLLHPIFKCSSELQFFFPNLSGNLLKCTLARELRICTFVLFDNQDRTSVQNTFRSLTLLNFQTLRVLSGTAQQATQNIPLFTV